MREGSQFTVNARTYGQFLTFDSHLVTEEALLTGRGERYSASTDLLLCKRIIEDFKSLMT